MTHNPKLKNLNSTITNLEQQKADGYREILRGSSNICQCSGNTVQDRGNPDPKVVSYSYKRQSQASTWKTRAVLMAFSHWLTKWTHDIQAALTAIHLTWYEMNWASHIVINWTHIGLLFYATISFDLESKPCLKDKPLHWLEQD